MSIHIQINPTAEVHTIGSALAELLDEAGQDYDMRYMCIEATDLLLARIRGITPRDPEEAAAVGKLLEELQREGAVELFLSV